MTVDFGSRRTVTGAHYGLRDWMAQRITAALMALFTLVLLVQIILTPGEMGYRWWASMFVPIPMKLFTFVVALALAWHAWVGMRDIWMDYIKPVGLRLVMHVFTLVWLLACAGWVFMVLSRL